MNWLKVLSALGNLLMVLAYFFNPRLQERQERDKIWAIFHDLEERLAKALLEKNMTLVEEISHWLQEMRDRYSYIKEGSNETA